MVRVKRCPNGAITLTMNEREARVVGGVCGAVIGADRPETACRAITDQVYHKLSDLLARDVIVPSGTVTFSAWQDEE